MSESHYINMKLSSFSFAKNSSAVTKPLAQFIKYLSYGEDTPGILDVRKKRAVSFLP